MAEAGRTLLVESTRGCHSRDSVRARFSEPEVPISGTGDGGRTGALTWATVKSVMLTPWPGKNATE